MGVNGPGVDGDSNVNGDDNLDADAEPDFVDANDPAGDDGTFGTEDDGLRLLVGSPALDAGDNAAVPSGITTDLLGENRIQDGDGDGIATVSLGAYERAVDVARLRLVARLGRRKQHVFRIVQSWELRCHWGRGCSGKSACRRLCYKRCW